MPGKAMSCLVLRDDILGYLGTGLDHIDSPTQIFLC